MRQVKFFPGSPAASTLCLGTGGFGTKTPRPDAFAQMDYFFEKGGNFFDTARVYADWLPGGHGASEITLGAWIAERKCRPRVVVSTKGAHPDLKTMTIARMSPAELRSDLEESLKALGTDYIDIYFLHRDDVSRPVEEILTNLEAFRKEGKILHYGCSNWRLPRMKEAAAAARAMGAKGFLCNQIRWGLGDVNLAAIGDKTTVPMDAEFFSYHEQTKMAVMAYTSSCGGYFSKVLKKAELSKNATALYGNEPNRLLLEKLPQWEKAAGRTAAALVSAYVPSNTFPAAAIASFSSMAQLEEAAAAHDTPLPAEYMAEIRRVKRFVL